jgi:2'-5' RNA ligase
VTELERAFVAVFPPPDVVDVLDARLAPVRDLGLRVRWSRPEHWHVTVRFLGRVPSVEGLLDRLGPALATRPAPEELQLAGGGAFPTARRGSVLWVGFADGPGRAGLGVLAAAVEEACVAAGFAPEERPFSPHLTVARAPRARDLRPAVAAIGDAPIGGPWRVHELVLVASDTRPDGAVYEQVARLPLG